MNLSTTPHTIDTIRRDDDFDARTRRIRAKILDGIEETLDELAQPNSLRAAIRDGAARAARAARTHGAALLCRQALCRRAKICRRDPCTLAVRAPGVPEGTRRDRNR